MTLNKEGITREAEAKQKNNGNVKYPKRYNANVSLLFPLLSMAAHLSSTMRRQQDTIKETDSIVIACLYSVERERTQGTYFSYDSYARLYDRSCLPQWVFHCT